MEGDVVYTRSNSSKFVEPIGPSKLDMIEASNQELDFSKAKKIIFEKSAVERA